MCQEILSWNALTNIEMAPEIQLSTPSVAHMRIY